jgi:hypothetical protein
MKWFILSVFVVFISGICSAQKTDYLVTAKNDTLQGKIKLLSFDTDQAQIIVDGKKQLFQSYQIKTVQFNGELYSSIKRLDRYRIMKLLKSGYLSLYAYREPNQGVYDGRFFAKKDGTSLDMPNLSFKKLMSQFLSDCTEVADRIRNGDLARKDFEMIVNLYNDCVDANTKRRYLSAAPKAAPPAAAVSIHKVAAIESLQKKVASLPDFENKRNAQDLINDITDKVTKGNVVPPYLLEALKGYIGNKEEVKDELAALIAALKEN